MGLIKERMGRRCAQFIRRFKANHLQRALKVRSRLLNTIEATVLVDDNLTEEGADSGALPAHGLCLILKLEQDTGNCTSLIIDGGPSLELLLHNASSLDVDLEGIEAGIVTMWSFHHVLALLKLAERSQMKLQLPPPPKQRAEAIVELENLGAAIVPLRSPAYNERALLFKVKKGLVAVVGCSAYGVDSTLQQLALAEERLGTKVDALIGGFNISTYDKYGLRLLMRFAEKRGTLLIPLHSTSLEAREKLCRAFGIEETPGVGTRAVLE